jgi:Rrf2 family protein
MFSKTAQYALRAVTVIAELEQEGPVLAKVIASQGKVPHKYLSKVLRDLVRSNVLKSTRGIGGGFRLRRKPEAVKLMDVVKPFEDMLASQECPLGNTRCSDKHPCPMHERWKPVKESLQELLGNTTVADVIRCQT